MQIRKCNAQGENVSDLNSQIESGTGSKWVGFVGVGMAVADSTIPTRGLWCISYVPFVPSRREGKEQPGLDSEAED